MTKQHRLTIHDVFSRYYGECEGLNKQIFLSFIREAHSILRDYLLKGNVLQLPYNIGVLVIDKHFRKTSSTLADFGETNKLRKKLRPDWDLKEWMKLPKEERPVVYYDNDHSDGDVYRIRFATSRTNKKSSIIKLYEFNAVKAFRTQLAAKVKDPNNKTIYFSYDEWKDS